MNIAVSAIITNKSWTALYVKVWFLRIVQSRHRAQRIVFAEQATGSHLLLVLHWWEVDILGSQRLNPTDSDCHWICPFVFGQSLWDTPKCVRFRECISCLISQKMGSFHQNSASGRSIQTCPIHIKVVQKRTNIIGMLPSKTYTIWKVSGWKEEV